MGGIYHGVDEEVVEGTNSEAEFASSVGFVWTKGLLVFGVVEEGKGLVDPFVDCGHELGGQMQPLILAEAFGLDLLKSQVEGLGDLLDGVHVIVGELGVGEVSGGDGVRGVKHRVPGDLRLVQHGGEDAIAKA